MFFTNDIPFIHAMREKHIFEASEENLSGRTLHLSKFPPACPLFVLKATRGCNCGELFDIARDSLCGYFDLHPYGNLPQFVSWRSFIPAACTMAVRQCFFENIYRHIRECIIPEILAVCSKTKGYRPKSPDEFPNSILLLDCWKPHWDESVVMLCNEHHIRIRLIPANCTNMLQPNDQYINKALKDKIKRQFDEHMWMVFRKTRSPPALSLSYLKPLLLVWFDTAIKTLSGGVVKSSWAKATDHLRPRSNEIASGPIPPEVICANWQRCFCLRCVAHLLTPQYCDPHIALFLVR